MTPETQPLTKAECTALAGLHLECLSTSLVSQLGSRYAKAFYRYIQRSDKELLLVSRNDRELVAAGILSLAPRTLERRLILRTPLLYRALLHFPHLAAGHLRSWFPSQESVGATRSLEHDIESWKGLPELIVLFTSPAARGHGYATQLLGQCEELLAAHGRDRYVVKTIDDESNQARDFYLARGFVQQQCVLQHGKRLQVMTKGIEE